MNWRILRKFAIGIVLVLGLLSFPSAAADQWILEAKSYDDIATHAFPHLYVTVGVVNQNGETVDNLRAENFWIREDKGAFHPETVSQTGNTDETFADKSRPIRISILLDIDTNQSRQRVDFARKSICAFVNRFVMNREKIDDIELWVPGDEDALQPPTSNTGTLCVRVNNYRTAPGSTGRNVNERLDRLVAQKPTSDKAVHLNIVVASRRIERLPTPVGLPTPAVTAARPLYVISVLDREQDDDTWQYLRGLASRTVSGDPGIFDISPSVPDRNDALDSLVREIYTRYKTRYVLEYTSGYPYSRKPQKIYLKVNKNDGSISTPEQMIEFVPDISKPTEPVTAIQCILALAVLILLGFGMIAVLSNLLELQQTHYP